MSVRAYTVDPGTFPAIKFVTPEFCNYMSTDPTIIADQYQTIMYPTLIRPPNLNQVVPYKILNYLPKTLYTYNSGCIQFTKSIITRVY